MVLSLGFAEGIEGKSTKTSVYYYENITKSVNTFCEDNTELFNADSDSTVCTVL
jgi:hypothetical protein